MLADNGVVGTTYDYWPYGEIALQGGSDGTRFKFTGHERDGESGLDYMLARMYDPMTGRFLSTDPMAEKYPGISPYAYVAGNPMKYVDPDGKRITNPRKMVLANKALYPKLAEFDRYVAILTGLKSSEFNFVISGEDRYWGMKNGKKQILSATNHRPVEDSAIASLHLRNKRALAVDLKIPNNITLKIIEKAAGLAKLTYIYKPEYNKDHFHLHADPELVDHLDEEEHDLNYIPSDEDLESEDEESDEDSLDANTDSDEFF